MENAKIKVCSKCGLEKSIEHFIFNQCKACIRLKRKQRNNRNVEIMLNHARERANKSGLDFSLKISDIIIPDVCPVLGIPLLKSNRLTDNTPTIDRIDNAKGYIKGNICVISARANRLKSDATKDEIIKILEYINNKEAVAPV